MQVYNITLYDTPGQAVLDCPTYDHVSSDRNARESLTACMNVHGLVPNPSVTIGGGGKDAIYSKGPGDKASIVHIRAQSRL